MVEGYDPAVNDRFSSGYPDAPAPNRDPRFMGKGLDWSGVGWWRRDPHFSVALLSSRNFTFTRHKAPAIGDAIAFLGKDGKVHEYRVGKLQDVEIGKNGDHTLYADAGVGTFTETVPLSDQVCHYAVAVSEKGIEDFVGRKTLVYGHMARIGMNEIVEGMMLAGAGSEYTFLTNGLAPGMGKSEPGDSGSPAFLMVGGKLALVGTHWKDDTDCMISGLVEGMNKIMAADGAKLEVAPLGP